MNLDALYHFVAPDTVQAIGVTLLHFIWQGLLIALGLAVLLRLSAKGAANGRYTLSCFALLFLFISPVFTFAWITNTNSVSHSEQPPTLNSLNNSVSEHVPTFVAGGPQPELIESTTSIPSETIIHWLVFAWLAGVMILSIRLAGSWLYAQSLKRSSVGIAPEPWRRRLEQMAGEMSILRPVWLLRSHRVISPKVIGWLRPVILVPASLFAQITSEQLEAILLHELAHVRRHDYLVNLIQSAVETILFYHPAVWWVSARIRQERENCCDDQAVDQCGDAKLFSRALFELESWRSEELGFALGADDGDLMGRIRRLISTVPDTPRPVLPAVMFLSMLSTVAAVQTTTKDFNNTPFPPSETLQIVKSSIDPTQVGERQLEVPPATQPGSVEPRVRFRSEPKIVDLGQPITLHHKNSSLPTVLDAISQQTGLRFELPANASKVKLSVAVQDVALERVLDATFLRKEMSWQQKRRENLIVATWWEAPGPADRHRTISNASINAWEKLLSRKEKHVYFNANGLTLGEALGRISKQTGIQFTGLQPYRNLQVYGVFNDVRVFDLLETLLNRQGLTADYDDDGSVRPIPL